MLPDWSWPVGRSRHRRTPKGAKVRAGQCVRGAPEGDGQDEPSEAGEQAAGGEGGHGPRGGGDRQSWGSVGGPAGFRTLCVVGVPVSGTKHRPTRATAPSARATR